jgi:uncharacterized membrane protein YheB (UPF0754 family)
VASNLDPFGLVALAEQTVREKMNKLTPEQYESILRPVFKDDEMLMVSVGAVLGFLVGELQVFFVEQFAR